MDVEWVVNGAVEAARRALLQRDVDDIPASLRKVAKWSGPRLPPPLYKQLLERLETDERLRTEAAEHVADGDAVATAFLERHEGWWRPIGEAAAD